MLLLIPFTRFEMKTYLTAKEARQRLEAEIEPRSLIGGAVWRRDHRYFTGKVAENGRFQINRVIRYRNSFLPYIYGEIVDELDTTRIKMRLHPHPIVMVLMPLFIGIFLYVSVGAAVISGDLAQNWATIFAFLGFMMIFYIVILGFFNLEVSKAQQKLAGIFQEGSSGIISS